MINKGDTPKELVPIERVLPEESSSDPDDLTALEMDDLLARGEVEGLQEEVERFEEDERRVRIQRREAELENYLQEIKLREEYAAKLFRLTRWWIIGIGALLLLEGFGATTTFDLPDNVLMTAIGGTTVTVTGLFVVVVRYLFPRAEPDGPAPQKKPKQQKPGA